MPHKAGIAPLDIVEAIETRRSIRTYVQEPMNQDDLHTILRLTSLAPSSVNTQPWRDRGHPEQRPPATTTRRRV